MSANTTYARLGTSCGMSRDVLTSNEKFFPLTEVDYFKTTTQMARYPGPECDRLCDNNGNQTDNPKKSCTTGYRSICCGRK
jgi:hypothetical protein